MVNLGDRTSKAIERLKRLAEESESMGLDVPDVIEAVMGAAQDSGLEEMVKAALEAKEDGMTLGEIAIGIISLDRWRQENS